MATITRASNVKSSASNTTPYVLNLGDFSVYGIIINARDTVRLPSEDGNIYEYTLSPELLKQLLSSPKASIKPLEEKGHELPKAQPAL